MYHKSRCLYVVTDTLCDSLLKSCKAPALKRFSTFSSRKRKRSIAVDPPLIILISGKLFIIFILKLSKITLGKLFDKGPPAWDRSAFPEIPFPPCSAVHPLFRYNAEAYFRVSVRVVSDII